MVILQIRFNENLMTSGECALNSRNECLPFLQMGQHCSGSYTGLTHSGTAQSDTTQCTSLFGSQRHHSQGDGCGQRGKINTEPGLDDSVGFTFMSVFALCDQFRPQCSSFEDISQLKNVPIICISHNLDKPRNKVINY